MLMQLPLTQSEIRACAQRVCANVPPSKVMGKKHFQVSLPRTLCRMSGFAIKKAVVAPSEKQHTGLWVWNSSGCPCDIKILTKI